MNGYDDHMHFTGFSYLVCVFRQPSKNPGGGNMFSGMLSVHPSLRPLSVNAYFAWRHISLLTETISMKLVRNWRIYNPKNNSFPFLAHSV